MVSTGGGIVIAILLLGIAAGVGWVVYSRFRAQRLGLPPPSLLSLIPGFSSSSSHHSSGVQPAPGGIQGWINDRVRQFKNRNNRTATGAYEGHHPISSSSGGGGGGGGQRGTRARGGGGGFGPLDPDEAWDTRVGNEADYGYEEQELGLHPQHDSGRYDMNLAATPGLNAPGEYTGANGQERGRSMDREGGSGGGSGGGRGRGRNPFDDDTAEPSNMSLRGVSPRPIETGGSGGGAKGKDGQGDSPSERRSAFRENV